MLVYIEKKEFRLILTSIRCALRPLASLHFLLLRLLLRQQQLVVLIFRDARAFADYFINQPVLDGFLRREILCSTHVFRNRFLIFPSKRLHETKVIVLAHVDFVRSDLHVRGRVKHSIQPGRRRRNLRVWQCPSAPLIPRR